MGMWAGVVGMLLLAAACGAEEVTAKAKKKLEKKWQDQCQGYWADMERRGWEKYPGAKLKNASKKKSCTILAEMLSQAQHESMKDADADEAKKGAEIPADASEGQVNNYNYYLALMTLKKTLFTAFPSRKSVSANKNAAMYLSAAMLLKDLKDKQMLIDIEYLIEDSSEDEDA
eukprot:TRINITY_DN28442_c0_g1_i1.p2 TRINITY_DN28442_c0_g1~~TRINITY_DN28442_c0_g1_i1.p2  ORF type:complete len:173 (+),score=103.98 TRINITY_DN28442_c0_g1_i1:53-571(+)